MKLTEIRALGDAELQKKLEEAHQELFNLRFKLATRQLVNHRELPKVRKKIARINTIIRERELGKK
ncbi:MAG: 50S ribosomal protein L29 [Dehalococcoidia bacterium]|nr:50S ribosomal protein L29 [Dehalococcoidia bacterium]MDD5647321.1 50S ribosomal protein L29 [Dehalococcoidia bacterium]